MRSLKKRKEVVNERLKGVSIESLAKKFSVPRGTVYSWVKDVELSPEARRILSNNSVLGREVGRARMLEIRKHQQELLQDRSKELIENLKVDKKLAKVFCSLLFWAEGAKATNSLNFVNSDPIMIRAFLRFFRQGFEIDETKFRILVHIHAYHNDQQMKEYWSRVTNVPLSQFNESFQKPNTGLTKKEGYMGCISIRYYDAQIAKELTWLYTTLGNGK